MSKTITRAKLKGVRKLPDPCLRAKRSRHECGPDDPRVFCYGLMDWPDNVNAECLQCGAYVDNATPWMAGDDDV